MKAQENLFELIKTKLLPQFRLADVTSDLLGISQDAAYRRIRGDKELSMTELNILCSHFGVSMDEVMNCHSDNILFQQSSAYKDDLISYSDYLEAIADFFELISRSNNKKICYNASDIPLFHFIPFPELAYFRLYAWFCVEKKGKMSFETFFMNIKKEKIIGFYKKIYQSYEKIPSTEIWSNTTIDTIIHLLDYYYDLDYFEDNKTFQLLCNQLLMVIESLEQWTSAKKKTPLNIAPFNMYLSPVHSQSCFMLTQWNGRASTTFDLFMLNTIETSNESFCNEVEKWTESLMSRSIYLSGASQRERFRFFQLMKNKISTLKNKHLITKTTELENQSGIKLPEKNIS